MLLKNESIKNLSYYKTGGQVERIYLPKSISELQENLFEIKKDKLDYLILGLGSNSLILDQPYPGAFLCLKNLNILSLKNFDDSIVYAQAGVINTKLSEFALENNLKGLSWMNALPGQIGATTRMNARCFGSEISQIVQSVQIVDENSKLHYLNTSQNLFVGYKNTRFMKTKEIIVSVEIKAQKETDALVTKNHMKFCLMEREKKGHFLYPSCGCIFKNDYSKEVSVSSGLLIESCGLKQYKIGGAQISPHHANFVYNMDHATSSDILNLTFLMREKVYQEFGVWLEYEMEVLGEMSKEQLEIFNEKRPAQVKRERITEILSLRR